MSFTTITDVGPGNGLHGLRGEIASTPGGLSGPLKSQLVEMLYGAGLPSVDMGTIAPFNWTSTAADNRKVLDRIPPEHHTKSIAQIHTLMDLEALDNANISTVAIFLSASETFSQRHTNRSLPQMFTHVSELIRAAQAQRYHVRGYIGCVWGCPYEGSVGHAMLERCANFYQGHNVTTVMLADDTGMATPKNIELVLKRLRYHLKPSQTGLHLYNTYGQALANVCAALDQGIQTFDAAIGGLTGGLAGTLGAPAHTKGVEGIVSTEDLVYMLHGMGYTTGIDEDLLLGASLFVRDVLHKPLRSHVAQMKLMAQLRLAAI